MLPERAAALTAIGHLISPQLAHFSAQQLCSMLRITSAASGEEVAVFDAGEFEAMVREFGSTIGSLKRCLAQKYFHKKLSRFQLRILLEGDSTELPDDGHMAPPLELQLFCINLLPPDAERDDHFVHLCECAALSLEQSLKAGQDPNVIRRSTPHFTGLQSVAYQGRSDVGRLLLEARADVDLRVSRDGLTPSSDGLTPLHIVTTRGHVAMARVLLDFGADKEAATSGGWRPLHFAAQRGAIDMVGLLLEVGVEKEAVEARGRRPLHVAAESGHRDIARLLLDAGVEKETQNIDGQRPLHNAAAGGHLEVVRLLLESGVQGDAQDKLGRTASQLASLCGREEVAQFLTETLG